MDHDGTYLNKVLFGPSTFQEAKAEIDALPSKQPNGRKIRSDANYTAQLVCTFPEELDEDKLNAWAASTVQWASKDAPGQLLYAVMHRDEGRPHIHLGIAALEEESGKLNYKALFGRDNKDDPGYRLMAMQGSYATAIKSMGVAPTEGKEYEATGMNAWRELKAKTKGRKEMAAELQPVIDELKAENSKNLMLSESLEAARQGALTADLARKDEKQRANDAVQAREDDLKTIEDLKTTKDTLFDWFNRFKPLKDVYFNLQQLGIDPKNWLDKVIEYGRKEYSRLGEAAYKAKEESKRDRGGREPGQ